MIGWLARQLLALAFALGLGVGGWMDAVHAAVWDGAVTGMVMGPGAAAMQPADGTGCPPCDGAGGHAVAQVACAAFCPPPAAAMPPAGPAPQEPGLDQFPLYRPQLPVSLLRPPDPHPPRSVSL